MFLFLVTVLIICVIIFLRHIYTYWKRKEFPYVTPIFPFGNLKSVAKSERSFGLVIYDLYINSKKPFIGIYLFFRPAVLICDPELVRKVLVQDFASFHDRGVYCNEERDPVSGTLFALRGARWKNLRMSLVPTFTSGRLKAMFSTIYDVGEKLQNNVDMMIDNDGVIDVKEMYLRYSLDIIASVIFGLNLSTIEEPDHIFKTMSLDISEPDFSQAMRNVISFLCPNLFEIFRSKSGAMAPHIRSEMIKMVKTTIELREKNNVVRKDLMQLLIQLRNGTTAHNDDDWEFKSINTSKKHMSIESCAGQAFIFYVAGSETIAATMSFCLFELGRSPVLMKRAQDEIETVLKKHDGKITFESLHEMEFLELCIKETLRKYPGLPILNRECTIDFKIPDSNFTIEKGTAIVISLFGILRDPKYFPDPLKFDPYRFLNPDFNDKYYIPFGDGPRICIAYRMGKLVSKMGLVMMLMKYNFESVNKNEIEFGAGSVPLIAKGGIPMKITKRL